MAIITTAGIAIILICNNHLMIYTGLDAAKGSMSFNAAIAAVTTIGYSGTLLAPVIIGYISHISNLLFAFVFICIALILTGIFSLILKEK